MANEECERLVAVRVNESPETVEILAFGARVAGDTGCSMALDVRRYIVTLDQPLGGRRLIGCLTDDRPPLPSDCAAISP